VYVIVIVIICICISIALPILAICIANKLSLIRSRIIKSVYSSKNNNESCNLVGPMKSLADKTLVKMMKQQLNMFTRLALITLIVENSLGLFLMYCIEL